MTSRQTPPSRNESAEGKSVARSRWFAFLGTLDPELLSYSGVLNPSPFKGSAWRIEEADRKAWARQQSEFSELLGFWVSWHTAGGFDQLENQGWHRATIYRKIKKFRERFGSHPDEFEFPWITLDLHRLWTDDIVAMLSGGDVELVLPKDDE